MKSVTVKVCGITRAEDGLAAARAGANAVGFVFAPSSRRIHPDAARDIARVLPPLVARVGVFVDSPAEEVVSVVQRVGLDVVQLHGDEPAETARYIRERTRCRIVKAVRLRTAADLARVGGYPADALLADTYHPSLAGGTGSTFPWEWLTEETEARPPCLWLAGGLRVENIRTALQRVRPDGVDVSSGVEAAPGRKDPELIRRFIREVRRFELAVAAEERE